MFDAAARHQNFRLAALELNLTQGAVAQQVRKLEADLGVQLFQRQARGLKLTDHGNTYHLAIHRALNIIDQATQLIQPEEATITISITPSFASKWLVPRLSNFLQQYPNINVQTIATEKLTNFQSDNIDLAIRQGRLTAVKGLHTQALSPLNLRAVCSPHFAKDLQAINRLEDCLSYPLIQDSHKLWDTFLSENELTTQSKIAQFNQTTLAIDAAANGQGIALAPQILFNNELAQGRLIELCPDTRDNQGGYYLVYPDHHKNSPNRDALINWIFSEFQINESSRLLE
ncbi:hypothetical protein DS885_06330 [Psychromonas sp. B3M02]|uniref:LysR substrate-binding domain-containing protein n=1 Tax=Psychromonas sp. B3M02 TaxID=2267226 RepID=UPI000DEBB33C|nr:LysR substrate-binding domain-containing protein [Psychromonas sp. B3M02]RBW46815.1 hypothetical protein DS885_06330 [Psychromonas sp. B3M02]